MKSKEAIRNTILQYTNQIWGTKKIERLDLLVQMMIGTLTDELYLSQNKLHDLDTTLLEKIARRLTPKQHIAIRPAHTILQMRAIDPIMLLSRNHMFKLEWMSEDFFIEKGDGIVFHPISDMYLFDLEIDSFFYHKKLFSINSLSKKIIQQTHNQPVENAIWLGLNINQEIDNLQHLSFYFDFPNYSEIDELYDVLPYVKCFIGEKEVGIKSGFSIKKNEKLSDIDFDVLHIYEDHYLTINEPVYLNNLKGETIPKELFSLLDEERTTILPHRYWVKFVFPAYFTHEHLTDIFVAVNAFPVSNKRLVTTTVIRDNLAKMNILPSYLGEKLLSVESVIDSRGLELFDDIQAKSHELDTYHLETTNRIFIEEHDLTDYLEQLQDIIEDERSVFTGIDKDQVADTLTILKSTENKEIQKKDTNDRGKSGEVSRLSVVAKNDISFVRIDYWLTLGEHIGNIPAGKLFEADKSGRLDGFTAISLIDVYGSKEFKDIQDIMSIDRYIFTSKDRIITEHNIKAFCESELGKAIEEVEIKLGGKISPKPKQGIIRVIRIILIPSSTFPNLLYTKGVLKSLKIRIEQRSPSDFIYDISIKT